MPAFIHDDFLLPTPASRTLFHEYAGNEPIFDFHCHLPPAEIACDQRWDDIVQVWLGADHYKWRAMRSDGVDERLVTGDAPAREKFLAWAGTMDHLLRNPLFDWSHLELARYFGVFDRLSPATAESVRNRCNDILARPDFSARGLLLRSKVKAVCTTDDPADDLASHAAIRDSGFAVQVLPAWRSDKASKIDDTAAWNLWMDRLEAAAGSAVRTWDDFLEALEKRRAAFSAAGCRISDYGVGEIPCVPYDDGEIRRIFRTARTTRQPPTPEETQKFQSAWLYEGLAADARSGWAAQLHFGCIRNANSAAFRALGPDTGFDVIGDWPVALPLARLLDRLERADALPRLTLYTLNPRDNEVVAAMMGAFQRGPVAGKIQMGAGWWFNDQKDGMLRQLEALSQLGLLARFVGMVTDSRSFLSYTRHEYFRRILCNLLGREIEDGALPRDFPWIGGIVRAICYRNAATYFNLG
jgi:glucuronate isomerase